MIKHYTVTVSPKKLGELRHHNRKYFHALNQCLRFGSRRKQRHQRWGRRWNHWSRMAMKWDNKAEALHRQPWDFTYAPKTP